MEKRARVIAFYLPQFHPIPENDIWWGKGFTEWTNVGKAKRFYKKHYQPRVPADLGYYDLRVPETRKAQADMAREFGVEGFCYWHYWFGNGKRLIERPFNEVVSSGEPDFPFCLAWANESWKGFAHGLKNRNLLIEQLYPGIDDYTAHFYEVLPAFKDKRYIKVNGKPLFMIYKSIEFKDVSIFIELWNKLARENGLEGIYFIAQTPNIEDKDTILNLGFEAINVVRMFDFIKKRNYIQKIMQRIKINIFNYPRIYNYSNVLKWFSGSEDKDKDVFPSIFPNWDHTPRSGREGIILHESTPELFRKHVAQVVNTVKDKKPDERIIFVKSWNEWAEGNYMEPDLKFGMKYLEALKEEIH
ncbi:glycosyltransferase WbsX family protein [Flavobacterium undicola]|uniref:glycosyltransferase WbsX family protein n=1 Tax=Flavobacterium undicola TaxID=1932779 RepID=UPI001378B185|nr:glycoside hydrolase family 99-like domain-containing protein [Flavobacterium undicola]MBA0884377.1 glycoside hydrolase family 99-like domain-containing protein [Flavobacterium undicola]